MYDVGKEPSGSWIHHGPEKQAQIDNVIWKIMDRWYPGAVNPKNPSLMAQRLFAISRSIYNDIEVRLEAEYAEGYAQSQKQIEALEATVRELRGIPPLPPVAIA